MAGRDHLRVDIFPADVANGDCPAVAILTTVIALDSLSKDEFFEG
ncbi:hypothetical protein SAMCFNEI73_pB0331 (plasmid) [Sinorhizobium americanum]|uniref:Uncharacterized protein n=1 Tax=Sinorhizobium americanum TaxID=194963 RepID=A0A1L3LTW6_9HYPH|nr:hypothetical protein SAMCCGM7_pB0300 [Sinorhizobium americanum CCGM7]APG93528.1 hypothetical protein SAMCFNEI73_pB0331 [Sinorhizobium americanum]